MRLHLCWLILLACVSAAAASRKSPLLNLRNVPRDQESGVAEIEPMPCTMDLCKQCCRVEYDYSLDLWSLGCMFAGMIFGIDTLFHGRDNNDQLVKIVEVLGTDAFEQYLRKYSLTLGPHYDGMFRRRYERRPWSSFVTQANQHMAHPVAIDLLDRLLRFDHQERPTAQEAMSHAYFDPVRNLSWLPEQPHHHHK